MNQIFLEEVDEFGSFFQRLKVQRPRDEEDPYWKPITREDEHKESSYWQNYQILQRGSSFRMIGKGVEIGGAVLVNPE